MEVNELIKKFAEFLEKYYQVELLEKIRKGEKSLVIDFAKVIEFDPELGDVLLDEPEEILKALELGVQQINDKAKNFVIRVKNLPESTKIFIRNIRSVDLGKFLTLEGVVRRKSDVRPHVTTAKFECPSCGNTLSILQLDNKFKEPSRCSCGRKGKFRLLSKELVDAQGLVLEEIPEKLDGGEQPKRLDIFLKNDLVSPLSEKKTNPGSRIVISGIVKEVPIMNKTGAQSTKFDLVFEANCVESVEEDFNDISISEEEEKKILELSKDDKLFKKLTDSVAPSIYGHDKIKEALLLQLAGGVRKVRGDGGVTRGDIHILLVGDPGGGKSQLLKRIGKIGPKARYVTGRGATGSGLTATVVKDEFIQGWSLEAGALVLANKGICAIDELDKMTKEDTWSMHEAMEQQSYHPETELILYDGSRKKIGPFVDQLMEKNKEIIQKGINCEILPINNIKVLSTDFEKITPVTATNVSRHTAPKEFIKISYSNGRKIVVTPEHPIFVWNKNKIVEVPAKQVREDSLSPAPRKLPVEGKNEVLFFSKINNQRGKHITFPRIITGKLAKLLGYLATEGHSYYNPTNRYAEIGISNTDEEIIKESDQLFRKVFNTSTNLNIQKADKRRFATKTLYTLRCSSKRLYEFFSTNFKELTYKAPEKRVSNNILTASEIVKLEFLRSAFRGDGFVDSERFGFRTASYDLAKDYQDLLLQNSIWSYIASDRIKNKEYYKVVVSGTESSFLFLKKIVTENGFRRNRIKKFCERSTNKRNQRDVLPFELAEELNSILKEMNLSDGYFYKIINSKNNSNRFVMMDYLSRVEKKIELCEKELKGENSKSIRKLACVEVEDIAMKLKSSSGTVYNYEKIIGSEKYRAVLEAVKILSETKIKKIKSRMNFLIKIIKSDLRFVIIKKVEKIPNTNCPFVYDVSVEPTRNFISEGLVLHNSVSISKANIQASLRCETTIIAAANPKFGRFDPYETIASQINLPSTLINRFDLIFPIKDLPDEKKDEKLASFVLELHRDDRTKETEISTDLLRKYLAYVRQNVKPILTQAAIDEIKNYFLKLRQGASKSGIKSIPISTRQLEGMVRLSEAGAKLRLSDKVMKKDAQKAVELVDYCLRQVAFDEETGTIDIDRIATEMPATQRNKIIKIKEIIMELEKQVGKLVPLQDLMKAANEEGLEENDVDDAVQKLKRAGDIYEPKNGFVSRI